MVLLDDQGLILAANHGWKTSLVVRSLGVKASGVGVAYFAVVKSFVPHVDEAQFQEALEAVRSGREPEIRYSYALDLPGGPRWRQVQVTRILVGGEGRFVAIHEDLTDLARAQQALRESSAQLLTARDEERRRIALELHDSISHHLGALGLTLTRLRKVTHEPEQKDLLEQMSASLREAVQETRVVSYLMVPRGLLREGLEASARSLAEGLALRGGLAIDVAVAGAVDSAPADVQHAVLRILQEALANVHRHAGARSVRIGLTRHADHLEVSIVDDGCGLPKGGAEAIGVGIAGMRARAEHFGGKLDISSSPQGACVTARIPLAPAAPASATPPAAEPKRPRPGRR